MPSASQTSRRPGPANFAASGTMCPAFPLATAEQPVTRTRISFSISRCVSVTCPWSCGIFGLLQPTTPTAPRILPALIASTSGSGVPPSASRIASTEKPAIMSIVPAGILTRSGLRLT